MAVTTTHLTGRYKWLDNLESLLKVSLQQLHVLESAELHLIRDKPA